MKYLIAFLIPFACLLGCETTEPIKNFKTYQLEKIGQVRVEDSSHWYSHLYEVEIEGVTYYATTQHGGNFALTPKVTKPEVKEDSNVLPEQE